MTNNYIELFLESLIAERNSSKNTVEAYKRDLELFLAYLINQNKTFDLVTHCDIDNYFAHLKENKDVVSTIQRKLTALKQFYQFLVSEDILKVDPTEKIIRPKSKRPIPKIVSLEDVKKLFHATDEFNYEESIRIKLILLLLYGSGLRVSELISLKLNAFNNKFLRVYGKGAKERIVPLAPQTEKILKEYISLTGKKDWIFESKNGKPITRQRIFQILKELAIRANLPKEILSPHVLRHAFATHILDNGGNLISIKKMLGHKRISTTEIYTHVSKAKLTKIVKEKHPINKII